MVSEISKDTYNDKIDRFVLYAKSTTDGSLVAVEVDPTTGALQVGDPLLAGAVNPAGTRILTTPDLPSGAVAASTTPVMESITIVAANTEYSKALPEGCKKLTFQTVNSTKSAPGSSIRYAFAAGKVAGATLPFQLLPGGAVYSESDLDLSGKTLYVAGVTAGDIVLIEWWT